MQNLSCEALDNMVRVLFRFDFTFILPPLARWTVYVKKNRSFTMGLLGLNAAPRDNVFRVVQQQL